MQVKIQDILLSFLLKNRRLALPGLGTFTLGDTAYVLPDDGKQPLLPPGSIAFEQNPQTAEDPELIAEISKATGKIKPLASSDLETIIIQGRQLLNISKPFHLPGIGYLQMDQHGKIGFTEHVEDDHRPETAQGTDEPDESIRFGERYRKPATNASSGPRTLAIAVLALLGLGLLTWLGYYVYQRSAREEAMPPENLTREQAKQDTVEIPVPVRDTTQAMDTATIGRSADTATAGSAPVIPAASAGFNIIIENSPRDRAMKRFAELREWGHQVGMTTRDSSYFKIFIPIEAPLSDSARHRDSLSLFFGRKVRVETRNHE